MLAQKVRELGLRERGKHERKQRIIRAARDVFLERGYDGATTREIAVRAEIAIGTLFVYAADKRDLLFLVINDELDDLMERAFISVSTSQPLLEQVLNVFGAFYRYFSRNVKLGRFALREMAYYTSHPVAQTEQALQLRKRQDFVRGSLSALISRAQQSGEIGLGIDSGLLAFMFLSIYNAEIRRWLNTDVPEVEEGIDRLRAQFRTVFEGLGGQQRHSGALRTSKQTVARPRKSRRQVVRKK